MKKQEPNISASEYNGDYWMEYGHYKTAEDRYRKALSDLGRKTWKNRKDWNRVWNKMMAAMHQESEMGEGI